MLSESEWIDEDSERTLRDIKLESDWLNSLMELNAMCDNHKSSGCGLEDANSNFVASINDRRYEPLHMYDFMPFGASC